MSDTFYSNLRGHCPCTAHGDECCLCGSDYTMLPCPARKLVVNGKDDKDVRAFFGCFPSHLHLVGKVFEKITEVFGDGAASLRLDVSKDFIDISRCPDCKFHRAIEHQKLWVYVQTELGVEEIIELDKQYTEWHIDHMNDSQIMVHVEFL